MAEITFWAGEGYQVGTAQSSGLGFYGASFGASVQVGVYQSTTFITDGNGLVQGPQADNVKWVHASSGEIAGGVTLHLLEIPNDKATCNIRFTDSASVRVQNVEARIYNRENINSGAQNVIVKAAEIIHPNPVNGPTGSGDHTWITPQGSATTVPLAQSPGISGQFAGSGITSQRPDTRHDWYLALSASPVTIGSKLFALYVSLEYL